MFWFSSSLMALSAASRTKWSCFCAKTIRASSPAESMKVLAQTEFSSNFQEAASCTKITSTNSVRIGRVQIRCLKILMRATPSFYACGCIKVWCHNHTIKAVKNAKITTKLCMSSWFDKNNSLKQTDHPALLSKAGTNAVWASKLQNHKIVSSEWLAFVKWPHFDLRSMKIKWGSGLLSF